MVDDESRFFVVFAVRAMCSVSDDELRDLGFWPTSNISLCILPSKRIIAGNALILSGNYSYRVNRNELMRTLIGVEECARMDPSQRESLVRWGIFVHSQIYTGSPLIFQGKMPETVQMAMILASRSAPMCIKDVRNNNGCIDARVMTSKKGEISGVAVVEKASGDTLLFCRIGMDYY